MASSPQQQIEVITRAAASPDERAIFLSNPEMYAARHNVKLDPELVEIIVEELHGIERQTALLGFENPFLEEHKVRIDNLRVGPSSPIEVAAWPLVAYYVVTTAAAVVSAVSTTYVATKWLKAIESVQPESFGLRAITGR